MRKSPNVFAGRGSSFVGIIANKELGGAVALTDYLQMRSSQMIRQMRQMQSGSEDLLRVRHALRAMSEASRLIQTVDAPAMNRMNGAQGATSK